MFFSDFLIIFDVAFFAQKNLGTCKKHRKCHQKKRSGRVLSSKNCHVFDFVKVLKFKMWKGGGGYGGVPPLFVLGGFRSQKLSKKNLLEKSLRRNAVNISVVAFCGLLPWKVRWYLRCFMHVFSQNIVNTSVFEKVVRVVKKHFQIQHFGHVVLRKCRK